MPMSSVFLLNQINNLKEILLMRAFEFFEARYPRREKAVDISLDEIAKKSPIAYDLYQNGFGIYRGMEKKGNKVFWGNSASKERTSRFATTNSYNIWASHDRSWSAYPKRSRSWICSTDKTTAGAYGKLYTVFPEDNSLFGICPGMDFQMSFDYAFKKYSLGPINFNSLMQEFMKEITGNDYDSTPDYAALQQHFKLIEEYLNTLRQKQEVIDYFEKQDIETWDKISPFERNIFPRFHELFEKLVIKNQKFEDVVRDALDPKNNGFKTANLSNLSSLKGKDLEIWFSGPAYFIKI